MKKLLILTEGGGNVGFGHVTRCLSLCQAFEAHGYVVEFLVNGDDSIKSLLDQRKVMISDWRDPVYEDSLMAHVDRVDVVIVDSYLSDINIFRKISKRAKAPVYLDDYRRLEYPKGVVLNWGIHAKGLNYPDADGVHYLLGPGYISLQKPFMNVPEPEIKKNVSSVMVTFGGDDSKNVTPRVLEFLETDYPELKQNVVIGSAFKNKETIEAFKNQQVHLFHAPGGAGMRMIMETSDIAISSGGQTLYELARVGVPTVAVAVADNQRENVIGWEKAGFIENAGFWSDDDLMDNIKALFRKLLDFDCRVQAVKVGRKTVPGNGAKRIIEFIENQY